MVWDRNHRVGYAAAAGTVLIGASFILLSRFAGKTSLTAYDMMALRIASASLCVLPFAGSLPKGSWRDRRLWLLTVTGGLMYGMFVYMGFKHAPAAHAAIILPGLQPFLMAAVVWALGGKLPARARRLGLVLIGIGVACVGVPYLGGEWPAGTLLGDGLIFASSLSWAVYAVLGRRWGFNPWVQTRFVVLASALLYLPIYVLWLPKDLGGVSTTMLAVQALVQGLAAMILSMWLFLKAVEALGPERTGALVALNPVIAGVAAAPLLGEALSGWLLAGLLCVSLGAFQSVRPMR